MGLDQAFISRNKVTGKESTLMVFRNHDRLHGRMEQLAYQKGIVNPALHDHSLNYHQLEKQIKDYVQLKHPEAKSVRTKSERDFKGGATTEIKSYELKPIPTKYCEGRLHLEWVPLTLADLQNLQVAIKQLNHLASVARYASAQALLFPSCQGLFFGHSLSDDWKKTERLVDDFIKSFDFKTNDLFYKADW